MLEILKVFLLGIVEGITEWLPISSTGHMILVDEFVKLKASPEFMDIFLVVIQLGAILAVVMLFWNKIWPFHLKNNAAPFFKDKNDVAFNSGIKGLCNKYIYMDKIILWLKILVASVPAAILGIAFDDQIDAMLTGDFRAYVVSAALIIYGILFIIIENMNKKVLYTELSDITFKTAFFIGLIQCLALIPGTSRSGSTILGASLLGTGRVLAAEFSFFLSIPAMVGGSAIKLLKFFLDGNSFSTYEIFILLLGMAVAFIVSVLAIKFLVSFIKKHDFKAFGYYRIILGAILIVYFALTV
ncbi:MAG: undecaprenyl-diphosphate phosphatase [Oscillospiraceae bacterium]|nr:undecaprenyl-diphosphate phosphatase [Oscillospiraceae bacterium]